MTDRPLPTAVLESHIGIMGKTGSGKSNLAKVVVEGLLDDGERVCVFDPTGTWYGLRLTRAGKPSKYSVVMFGGEHADLPLAKTHGTAIAETIGTTATPAIIDLRRMTVGERTTFAADFAETLLQKNRGTLHLVVDEAHLFAPKGKVQSVENGRMLSAWNNLVSLGRGVGLRIILISQRPAKLHNDSLTQIETLVAMRLVAPWDRDAIGDWIKEVADPTQGRDLLSSLAKLPTGEGWIWSPLADILERQNFPLAATLDTGKPGEQDVELGAIDVAAVRERLNQVGVDIDANDPKRLRARIAELERAMAAKPTETVEKVVEKLVEVPVLDAEVVSELSRAVGQMLGFGEGIAKAADLISRDLSLAIAAKGGQSHEPRRPSVAPVQKAPPAQSERPIERQQTTPASDGEVRLGKAERTILAALATQPAGLTRIQLSLISGYSIKSSSYSNALGALRSAGLVTGNPIRATLAGLAAAGDVEPMPQPGDELLAYWLANPNLGRAERQLLAALAAAYPREMDKAELADASGYSATSSSFSNALGRLRSLALVTGWRASDELMGGD